ncbi:MAG: 6-carboxytetrahydropterin synthase QueD [Dehalococcoidales bacterium]|nr:6-carboxytetrahydropterin synthase QueD [Dehalococcoidales bacterium]
MYEVSVKQHFDAAHYLRYYQGKCEALHGHRYEIVAKVKAARLNEIGLACDFTELKGWLADILSRYDHTCLNDVPPFNEINPSAENIAATIYDELNARMTEAPFALSLVEAWESPDSSAAYSPG